MKLTVYDRNQTVIRRRNTVQHIKTLEVGVALDSRQLDTGEIEVLILTDGITKWMEADKLQVVAGV